MKKTIVAEFPDGFDFPEKVEQQKICLYCFYFDSWMKDRMCHHVWGLESPTEESTCRYWEPKNETRDLDGKVLKVGF